MNSKAITFLFKEIIWGSGFFSIFRIRFLSILLNISLSFALAFSCREVRSDNNLGSYGQLGYGSKRYRGVPQGVRRNRLRKTQGRPVNRPSRSDIPSGSSKSGSSIPRKTQGGPVNRPSRSDIPSGSSKSGSSIPRKTQGGPVNRPSRSDIPSGSSKSGSSIPRKTQGRPVNHPPEDSQVNSKKIKRRNSLSEKEYRDYLSNASKQNKFYRRKDNNIDSNYYYDPRFPYRNGPYDPRFIDEDVNDFLSQTNDNDINLNNNNVVNIGNANNPDNDSELPDSGKKEKDKRAEAKEGRRIDKTIRGQSRDLRSAKTVKNYFAFGASFIFYGSNTIAGRERPKQNDNSASNAASKDGDGVHTFTADIAYNPMAAASIKFGKSLPALSGATYPQFFRVEVEIEYNRLLSTISNIGKSEKYPDKGTPEYPDNPDFGVPLHFGSGHLISFNVNGYADLVKVGPGYPYIGVGVGFGAVISDNHFPVAFAGPLFNVFAGYLFNISNKFDMSIGYRFTAIYPMSYSSDYIVPINGSTNRPTAENLVDFNFGFIHKIEVAFWCF